MRKLTLILIVTLGSIFPGCLVPGSSKPIEITVPSSVTSEILPPDNSFLIEIKDDHSVWYQIKTPDSLYSMIKVNEPVTAHLQQAIADYEVNYHDEQRTYLLKGSDKATFDKFDAVINALKQNNIYKYNLVSSETKDTEVKD